MAFIISLTSPRQPGVGVGVDKQFHVKQVPDVLLVEDEDTLEEDDVRREDLAELARFAGVGLEVVDGHLGRLAVLDVTEAVQHQVVVERVWKGNSNLPPTVNVSSEIVGKG